MLNLSSLKTTTYSLGVDTFGGGTVRASILRDRLLVLQTLVGQPLHRGGEVRVMDLLGKTDGDRMVPVRVLKDLQYSGPHNQQLLTMVNGEINISFEV